MPSILFTSRLADLSSMDSSETVHVDLTFSQNIDGHEMKFSFDTPEKLTLLDLTANGVYEIMRESLAYAEDNMTSIHTPQSEALIEAKEEDMEAHSLYSAFVLLWKAEHTDEDFVDVAETLLDQWRITESEWDEVSTVGALPYEEYVKRDRAYLEELLGMPVVEENEDDGDENERIEPEFESYFEQEYEV